jgi:hypothetical protein
MRGVKVARQPLADLLHLGHLTLQGAQHRPHIRPDRLRLHPHPLGDPADELIGVKRLAGRRASPHRHLQLRRQPCAQPPQLLVAHPLGQRHHRRHDHLLGRGPV